MGYDFTSGLQITVSSIHRQKHLGICLPLSVLRPGSVQVENFSAQVGNRTRAHGDESKPLEISMSSAMKGEPGLATGLTALGALEVRSPKLVSSEDRTGARAPSASYCSTEGVAPLHTAPPVPVTAPPVPVTAPPVPVTAPPVPVTVPPVPVLRHQCRSLRHQCRSLRHKCRSPLNVPSHIERKERDSV
jgi:hypothetical protein